MSSSPHKASLPTVLGGCDPVNLPDKDRQRVGCKSSMPVPVFADHMCPPQLIKELQQWHLGSASGANSIQVSEDSQPMGELLQVQAWSTCRLDSVGVYAQIDREKNDELVLR